MDIKFEKTVALEITQQNSFEEKAEGIPAQETLLYQHEEQVFGPSRKGQNLIDFKIRFQERKIPSSQDY